MKIITSSALYYDGGTYRMKHQINGKLIVSEHECDASVVDGDWQAENSIINADQYQDVASELQEIFEDHLSHENFQSCGFPTYGHWIHIIKEPSQQTSIK